MTLRVTFLGTGGAIPTTERNPSAVFVNREGEEFLFDCGEGTQRQMMRYGTGFSVSAVFLSHVHGDHVFGLPGLAQTWGFQGREAPLSVFTPRGTRRDVERLLTAWGDLSYPVTVEEIAPGETAVRGEDYAIEAVATEHRTTSVGYALVEDERKGRFFRERAVELGVPEGPAFGRLHEGEPVTLADGTTVEPAQVVGPPRPGRRVVYTGDTGPTETVVAAAEDADLLIHDATFAQDEVGRARETAHTTGREAGEIAARAGARRLALTHISPRYAGDASAIAAEARETFHGEVVLARDGLELEVPLRD